MTPNRGTANGTSRTRASLGVDGVEIKVTIRPDQELQGLRALELDEDSAEVRVICFYDTPKLDLFNAGVVLRARLVKGDKDDSTVKIRPVESGKLLQSWIEMPGFKIEADSTGGSCRLLSVPHSGAKEGRNRRSVQGGSDQSISSSRPIRSASCEFYPKRVDFAALRVLGPIRVLRWETKHKGFPHQLTSEEWRLTDVEDLLEVSIKVEPDQAKKARREFESHLRELGIDPAGAQETKTRTALKDFASKLKPA
jgi:hypothetical protein